MYDDIWNRVDNNLQFCKFSEGHDDAVDKVFREQLHNNFSLNIKLCTEND